MKSLLYTALCVASLLIGAALSGCSTVSDGKPNFMPNPDKYLDHMTSAQFSADAAKRSYEASAPKGGQASARAEFDQMTHRIDFVNLSDIDWTNVEVWINQKYVVFVPTIEKSSDSKRLDFEMFYDQNGHHFDTDSGKNPLMTLEIFRDKKMYTVPASQE